MPAGPAASVFVVTHPSGLAHDNGPGHPERPQRLRAVEAALESSGMSSRVGSADAPMASREVLDVVHSARYLDALERLDAAGGGGIDRDTFLGPGSLEAATRGAGGVVHAVRMVGEGRWSGAFVAMRPPGHHAPHDGPFTEPDWSRKHPSMGFCVLNHAAVGAGWAVRSGLVRRVAVVDWDAHHGNGTQDIFWSDPDVLYASIHQSPFYPGTGDIGEMGAGPGRGSTVNVPLPAGSAEDAYGRAMQDVIVPALRRHRPDVIVVSAGYDADARDPVCMMRLTPGAFFRFARTLGDLAPLVCVLEGGYDLQALGQGSVATMSAMLGDRQPPGLSGAELDPLPGAPAALMWVDRARAAHGAHIGGVGGTGGR